MVSGQTRRHAVRSEGPIPDTRCRCQVALRRQGTAGTPGAADGKLQAFINEVEAQAGKKITSEAAAILINAAT